MGIPRGTSEKKNDELPEQSPGNILEEFLIKFLREFLNVKSMYDPLEKFQQ